jgi:hypothetical protein
MNRTFGIAEAIASLRPGSEWSLTGEDYSGLNWLDKTQEKPTEKECLAEAKKLQALHDALEYQRLRAPEYPPITDYLDGVVKGDHAQIEAYVSACLAVKEKYPKTNG